MDFVVADFNNAGAYYTGAGQSEWAELEAVVRAVPPCLQGSDQAGKQGDPIFDPKATNELLTTEARKRGWGKVPVPATLTEFGVDWDAGKGGTLAEWQFSNYPFLWNNIIRSEAIVKGQIVLPGLLPIRALVVVTKSGLFPASNSTLYYEQAHAQITSVTKFGTFSIPIRLVGLVIPPGAAQVPCLWSVYGNRYGRDAGTREAATFRVQWRATTGKYGVRGASFTKV